MRTRPVLLVLTAALAACGPFRRAVPTGAEPEAEAGRPATPPARELACLAHPRIEAWEQRLRSCPELRQYTEESLARGTRYLPAFRRILEAEGVPASLALLPVIESGFYRGARGRHGELGLWQLRRPTARRFGLVVTTRRDDRLHPERATLAAARYLHFLGTRYGDWPLAIAAYNAGERRVDRALARDPHATFWELADRGYLPRTSTDFVPRFLAVVRLSATTSC